MTDRFSLKTYAFFILALLAVMLLCVCIGSVSIAPKDTLTAVFCTLLGKEVPAGISKNIILNVRLPRVLNVALVGAALSLCGAAMQGLLRNPLADGSTLGVSSGASLGAVIALALGVTVPGSEYGGTMLMAMAVAFLSLVLILSLAVHFQRHQPDFVVSQRSGALHHVLDDGLALRHGVRAYPHSVAGAADLRRRDLPLCARTERVRHWGR